MGKKPRLGLYYENELIKRRIEHACARRGISTTAYCTRAIEECLVRDGELMFWSSGSTTMYARPDRIQDEEH